MIDVEVFAPKGSRVTQSRVNGNRWEAEIEHPDGCLSYVTVIEKPAGIVSVHQSDVNDSGRILTSVRTIRLDR